MLSIPVFLGGERIGVTARFRYRLNGGHLSLMIKIDDPETVLQAAFDAVIARIGEGTNDHPIMYGSRPAAQIPAAITLG